VLLKQATSHADQSSDAEILLIDRSGAVHRAGLITNAFIGTARLDQRRDALLVTRTEDGVNNLVMFSLRTGAMTPITRNTQPA